MLKPMHIYVEYKVIVRKEIITDDNEVGLLKLQCDGCKAEVRRVMDKVVNSNFDYDKYWVECNVNADEV